MWASVLQAQPTWLLQWGVVVGAALTGAILDVSSRRIPNWLTGPVCLAGLVWATWVGGPAGLVDGAAACVMMALPYVLLFAFARGGAGDAKLMGAIGAWLGVTHGVVALVAVSLTGVVFAVAYAVARRQLRTVVTRIQLMTVGLMLSLLGFGRSGGGELVAGAQDDEARRMPYGPAVFVGVCLAAGCAVWRT